MPRILLIEDNKFLVKMYKTKLELEGYEVDVAYNGTQGLEQLRKKKPDLILLDLLMPEMDGFEFMVKLKQEDEEIANTTVIVFTNLGTEQDMEKVKDSGVVEYLIKANLTPQEVMNTIRNYLE